MVMKILVDVNVPKEVCERLRELGFDALYLTDIFCPDIDDGKILEWLAKRDALLLTRDRGLPETCGKIILVSQSPVKLAREAFMKLLSRQVFPKPLK